MYNQAVPPMTVTKTQSTGISCQGCSISYNIYPQTANFIIESLKSTFVLTTRHIHFTEVIFVNIAENNLSDGLPPVRISPHKDFPFGVKRFCPGQNKMDMSVIQF